MIIKLTDEEHVLLCRDLGSILTHFCVHRDSTVYVSDVVKTIQDYTFREPAPNTK